MKATKRCSKCKQNKPVSEFYRNRARKDGHLEQCKSCRKVYDKQFNRTEHRQAYLKKYYKEYFQNDENKASQRCAVNKYQKRHPEHQKARDAVKFAVRSGKLPRLNTKLCHYCPKPAQQYHHWHGYEKEHWLDVVPSCTKCHRKCHKKVA